MTLPTKAPQPVQLSPIGGWQIDSIVSQGASCIPPSLRCRISIDECRLRKITPKLRRSEIEMFHGMYDEFATNSALISCPSREMLDTTHTTAEPNLEVRTKGDRR